MFRRHLIALYLLAWAAIFVGFSGLAFGQNNFTSPGGANVPGMVQMCINGSGFAVPCGSAGAVQTMGVLNGGNVVEGSTTDAPCSLLATVAPCTLDALSKAIANALANGTVALGPTTPTASIPTVSAGYSYTNINTAATTTPKSGVGVLHTICLNTITAASTAQIYDNTAASGTKIGLITQATGQQPGCLTYDVTFNTGLTIVTTSGTPDYTVSWR